jgi:carbon-monoxide dehydrogenase medium subunit
LSKSFTADAVKGLAVDDSDMISDLHGTAAYRANLVRVLTGRAVTAAH